MWLRLKAWANRALAPRRPLLALGESFFYLAGRRSRLGPPALASVTRVLVIRPDRIGDLVLTTPFLRELRRNLAPGAWVTVLVEPAVVSLIRECPYVDEVLTYSWNRPDNKWWWRRYRHALALARNALWMRRFDLAILPRSDTDLYNATVVAYFSGAPWRVGYAEPQTPFNPTMGLDGFLSMPVRDATIRHELENGLRLIELLGGQVADEAPELWLAPEDRAHVSAFLREHGWNGQASLVALAPGAGEPRRTWPLERYAEVGRWLQAEFGVCLVIVGGPSDRSAAEALVVMLDAPVIDAAGQLTLRQTAALLEHCALYVGGDTGPMHLAAAAKAAVVEISCHPATATAASPNSPVRFGPRGVPNRILQPAAPLAPCGDRCTAKEPHCITAVTIMDVKNAAAELLAAANTPRTTTSQSQGRA